MGVKDKIKKSVVLQQSFIQKADDTKMLLDILFPMNHVIIDQLALNSVDICLHNMLQISLQKTVEKVSPILVTLTSRSDSNLE